MAHTIEEAKSGRSKCRGCGNAIARGELRFGERLPNPFADDSEMTLWFHITCGAMRRPASFNEVLENKLLDDQQLQRRIVELGTEHYRLDRIGGVERASSGRARCRHCQEPIPKDTWRIPLVFFEEGMFNNSGFIHVSCAAGYFGTNDILERLEHFNGGLAPDEKRELARLLD